MDIVECCTGVPRLSFHLTLDGRKVMEDDPEVRLIPGQVIRMHGRLRGGSTQNPRFLNGALETEWFCAACNRGGCWPTKQRCFRCNLPRIESEKMLGAFPSVNAGNPKGGKEKGNQQREKQLPGCQDLSSRWHQRGGPTRKTRQAPEVVPHASSQC